MKKFNDSICYATASNYLDKLFSIYPMQENMPRPLQLTDKNEIINSFDSGDNKKLIRDCIKASKGDNIFPIKDSYVAFLKHYDRSVDLNPETVNRIAGRIRELGISKTLEVMESPKETNRQLGQVVSNWLLKGTLGIPYFKTVEDFENSSDRRKILVADDATLEGYAANFIKSNCELSEYDSFIAKNKGIDFLALIHGKLIIGEFKFLSDKGGHQDRQLDDALELAKLRFYGNKVITIAVVDGVCYLEGTLKSKKSMFVKCSNNAKAGDNIFSALLLRDFLFEIEE